MRAGDLRSPVSIEQPSVSRNSRGEDVKSWSEFAATFAAIEPLKGVEKWEAQRVAGEEVTRIRIRWVSGLLPTMRIVFDSEYYYIEEILNIDERDREIRVIAKKEV